MNGFEELYARHAPAVYRFALSLSGNRATAEDLTSETFVRVWSARDRLELTSVIGYLITIARHLYLEQLRREERHSELDHEPADGTPGPQERAAGRSELDAVLADLQTLPEPDRAALLMRAHEQVGYEEIAAALKISVGAAKVKVHRARRRLVELRLRREGNPS